MPVSVLNSELFRTNELAREALFLASRTALDEFDKYKFPKENLYLTLIKYLKRMTMRCTPFGLFAGVSVGHFCDHTEAEFVAQHAYKRLTRFDSEAFQMLVDGLVEKYRLKKQLRYLANASIYEAGLGYFRYIEGQERAGIKQYQISSVERSPYLHAVLTAAKDPASYSKLVDVLETFDVNRGEAEEFIERLIETGILKSELEIKPLVPLSLK